jgi:antitoxin component YwqK of YwqJK toxin-antitoxin module
MNKKLFFLISFLSIFNAWSQSPRENSVNTYDQEIERNGKIEKISIVETITYYDNGRQNTIQKCEKGTENCDFISYYRNGFVMETGSLIGEELDGEYRSYFENGQLEEHLVYKNGYREGPYVYYYENGQLEEKGSFKTLFDSDGDYEDIISIGAYESYLSNGKLTSKGTFGYDQDLQEAIQIGTWIENIYYDFDEGDENPQIKAALNLLDGEMHGLNTSYYENGQINEIGSFKRGKPFGRAQAYHENGNIKMIKDFDPDGNAHGEELIYNSKGILIEKITYANGLQNGPYESYLDDGRPLRKGMRSPASGWEKYEEIGSWTTWTYFDQNGQLKEVETSINDVYNGPYEAYYEDGILKIKGNYVDGKLDGVWYVNDRSQNSKFKVMYDMGTPLYNSDVKSVDEPITEPYYKFAFQNNCGYKRIRLLVYYLDLNDEWQLHQDIIQPNGDYSFIPKTINRKIYFRANTTDGELIWEGDYALDVFGKKEGFREYSLYESTPWGAFSIDLDCD